jgi:hypothetical protein
MTRQSLTTAQRRIVVSIALDHVEAFIARQTGKALEDQKSRGWLRDKVLARLRT